MIEAASAQLGELLERAHDRRQDRVGPLRPSPDEADSLALARAAADALGAERVTLSGEGATVRVPVRETARAVTQLTPGGPAPWRAGLGRARRPGRRARARPRRAATPQVVLTGEEIRELGAAAAVTLVRALGGSVAVDGDRLRIRLPS